MTNQAKDKIAPIKLKLSLSSALQSPTTRPDASVKGKGKAVEENGGGGHLPPVRLKLSQGLIRSISSHNNEPSTPTSHGTETGPKVSTVNGASGLATPSTPNTLPESSTPSSSQSSRKKNGVSTPSVTKHGKVLGRPRGSTKKSKLSATPKASPSTKPSAVPPRLLSSGPSTPRVPPLTPSTPIRTSLPSVSPIPDGVQVKQEPDNDDVDPLSTPLSPSAMEMRTPGPEVPVEQLSSNHAYIPKATGGAVKRIKRPMKELMNKVMVELRRKDDYALFDEPVNLEDFPDYLGIVGGEDKMMDLGTMQSKIDNDDYDNFDQFKTDLETLAAAAEKFNPPGTVPHTSAQRVLAHGLKHIERNRPLVLTPTPSPEPEVQASDGTKTRGESMLSGRGATMPPGSAKEPLEVGPMQYIPEEMLQYAPGSATAQAVGWNLNGGRRQYARRQIRGREKFNGKWRHWALDGTRDLAEMDEPGEVFATQRMTEGSTSRRVTDWKGLRKDGNWWDFDIAGPSGQPPVHFSTFPRPAPLRQRDLTTNEWGVFPEIDAEMAVLSSRTRQSESSTLSDQLRPIKTHHRVHPLTPANFIDVYDDSAKPKHAERLRERVYGGVEGEAYHRSVSRFIDGAMESGARNRVGNVEEVHPESDPDHLSLREYVKEYWHSGLLRSTTVTTIDSTIQELKGLHETLSAGQILNQRQENLLQVVKMEHARQALLQITRPDHPLDIKPLLKEQGDFLCQGAGGRDGVKTGLEWVSNEIARMSKELEEKRLQSGKASSEVNGKVETEEGDANGKRKRESLDAPGTEVKKLKLEENIGSTTSSPLSQAPDTPPTSTKPLDAPSSASPSVDPPKIGPHPLDRQPMPSKDDSLKRLRLELVALSKFYPLAALRKMDKSDAERLLPPNVRALMSKPEAKKPEVN